MFSLYGDAIHVVQHDSGMRWELSSCAMGEASALEIPGKGGRDGGIILNPDSSSGFWMEM